MKTTHEVDKTQNTARRQQRRRLWFVQILLLLLHLVPLVHLVLEAVEHVDHGGAELVIRGGVHLLGAHELDHDGAGGHVVAGPDGHGAGQQLVLARHLLGGNEGLHWHDQW